MPVREGTNSGSLWSCGGGIMVRGNDGPDLTLPACPRGSVGSIFADGPPRDPDRPRGPAYILEIPVKILNRGGGAAWTPELSKMASANRRGPRTVCRCFEPPISPPVALHAQKNINHTLSTPNPWNQRAKFAQHFRPAPPNLASLLFRRLRPVLPPSEHDLPRRFDPVVSVVESTCGAAGSHLAHPF